MSEEMISRSVSMYSKHTLVMSPEQQDVLAKDLIGMGWQTNGYNGCQRLTEYRKHGKKGSWTCVFYDRSYWKDAKGVGFSHTWVSGIRVIPMTQWKAEVALKRSQGYVVIDETEWGPVTHRLCDMPKLRKFDLLDRARERANEAIDEDKAMFRLLNFAEKAHVDD